MTYESEKPDSQKVIDQGHGFVKVMTGEPDWTTEEASEPPDVDHECEYRRVEVRRDDDGVPFATLQLESGAQRIPIGWLSPRRPCAPC